MSPEEQVRRAARAKQIMADDLVVEAFAALERGLYEGWRETRHNDIEKRESAFRMLSAMDLFRDYFNEVMENGIKAAADIDFQQKSILRGTY